MKSRSRSRRGNARRRAHNSRRWMVAGLVTLPVLAIVGGGIGLNAYMSIEQIDQNYCYSQQYQEQSAFFIDYSFIPQIEEQQERDLKASLARAYDELPPNGRLSIFSTANTTAGNVASPVYVQCKPAQTTEDQAGIPAASKTPMELKRRAEEARQAYLRSVDNLVSEMKTKDVGAGTSPILEQVQAITRYYKGSLNVLSLYSDGINNGRLRQFCSVKGHLPRASTFLSSPDYRYLKPDPMNGVRVNVLLVELGALPAPGMPYCTNNELRDFWPAYFEAHGAIARLERL